MEKGVPTNLEECIADLMASVKPTEVDIIKNMKEDDFLSGSHHFLGRHLRNEWGLWQKDSPLAIYFKKLGLWHADDMSSVILCCFHRHLNDKPFDVEVQVAYYRAYWKKAGVKPED